LKNKNIGTKWLSVAVIFIFIGTSVGPNISGDIKKVSDIFNIDFIQNYWERKNFLGEPPEEEWNNTFGGTSDDFGNSVQQTADGGYIVAGLTNSYGAGNSDVWLIKTDSDGNKEWNKTFGGTNGDYSWSVQQTDDAGYIITASTYSYGAGSCDVWLIKTDSNGSKEWDETFGGKNGDFGNSVQIVDGGYIITGSTYSYGAGSCDIWLIKTDSNGNKEWDETFGGTDVDYGESVHKTDDGGYIVTGYTYSYGVGSSDVWMIKTESNGTEQWNKTFGGIDSDFGKSVQQTDDGGYIVAGLTHSYGTGNSDVWLIKTDSNGNKEWDKTYGGIDPDLGQSVQQTADEGYIVVGYTLSYGAGFCDVWLVKTDSYGNKEWDKTLGGIEDNPYGDFGHSVEQTADGGYIVAGLTWFYGAGYYDVWLIKVETENNPPFEPANPYPEDNSVDVDIETILDWTGGDPDGDTVTYDIYFGSTNPPPKVASNQSESNYYPGSMEVDTLYYWQIVAWDDFIPYTKGPMWKFTTRGNQPPKPPILNGPKSGKEGKQYPYTFVSEDPEGHNVFYEINWGDGNVTHWDGPHESNTIITRKHKWQEQGEYVIMAKAKDIYGNESDWGKLEISMPKNKLFVFNFPLLSWLFERFPNTFPILQYVLGL